MDRSTESDTMRAFLLCFWLFVLCDSTKPSLRLPTNYFPVKQHIHLNFYPVDSRIEGSTTIRARCDNKSEFATLTLSVGHPLVIDRVDMGSSKRVHFELDNMTEMIKIPVPRYSPEITAVLYFHRSIANNLTIAEFGLYAPFNSGMATLFEPNFARTTFPTFDQPTFRCVFTYSAEVFQEPQRFSLVLFNEALDTTKEKRNSIYYEFKPTKLLPAYLLEFAIVDGSQYKLYLEDSYFGIPIRVILDMKTHKNYTDTPSIKGRMRDVIKYTLSSCETKFGTQWLVSGKIDFLFTDMPLEHLEDIGGMEHPGMITMSSYYPIDLVLSFLVHELAHQWTGTQLVNAWWSHFWLNEGITSYVQTETVRDLIKFGRLTPTANTPDFSSYKVEQQIVQKIDNLLSRNAMSFYGISAVFYAQARYSVALLDTAMDGNLLPCLGQIMQQNPFASLSSAQVLEKLTNCPFSTINATEFMQFWLFDREIPIVSIQIEDEQVAKPQALISYTYMCSWLNITLNTCSDKFDPSLKPQFAVDLRDQRNNYLQKSLIVKRNNSRFTLEFDLRKQPLFFANMYSKSNFIVKYPDSVYEAYFDWIEIDASEEQFKVPKFYAFFVSDMVELARRDRIDMKYLFWLLTHKTDLKNMGSGFYAQLQALFNFECCLKTNLSVAVKNDTESWDLLCNFIENIDFERHSECEDRLKDIPEDCSWEYCSIWVEKFGHKFMQMLKKQSLLLPHLR